MTIRHMQVFIAVAEHGKMNIAAQKLFISQPTVSQAISEIENHYKILLFERLNRRLYITKDGEMLLSYARHIVRLFEEMERTLQNHSQNILLNIGATITVATCLLHKAVGLFEEQNKGIKIDVVVDNTKCIQDKILNSQLDLAIVEGEIKSKDLISLEVAEDILVLVCGQGHPFYKRGCIDIKELQGLPFIFREQGSGTRALFDKACQKQNISVHHKWICNNSEAIKNAVIQNQGLSVLSKRLVEKEVKENKLKIIEIKDITLSRKFCLIYHKNKYLSQQIRCFMDFMGDHLDE